MNDLRDNVVFDITLEVSGATLVYPGDAAPVIERVSDIREGDALTASRLSMGCHVGTHVDAPAHFLADGATVDELSLECFHGPAVVVDMRGKDVIGRSDVEAAGLPEGHHILLKTDNSLLLRQTTFSERYCTVSAEAAACLAARRPRAIGFDYYSLDPVETRTYAAHVALARAGIPVFVCLDLSEVPPGGYTFVGLPLRLRGVEAAPVRAVLMGA
ncbi:MAG: cyclase family protein [Phycisphaerae bacterium]|nr:cyclase family protein [Phycisphaerae bacterium]